MADSTDNGGEGYLRLAPHDIGGKALTWLADKVECPQLYPGAAPHGINKIVQPLANSKLDNGRHQIQDGCCKTSYCPSMLTASRVQP